LVALVALIALLVVSPLVIFGGLRSGIGPVDNLRGRFVSQLGDAPSEASPPPGDSGDKEIARSADKPAGYESGKSGQTGGGGKPGEAEPGEGGRPSLVQASPAAAVYAAVAPALPGAEPAGVGGTFQSTDDPSWAVTEIEAPNRDDGYYAVYTKKVKGGWEARRSVLADNPDYPNKGRAPLVDLPDDLRKSLYPEPESTIGPADSPEKEARTLASDSLYLGGKWKPVALRKKDGFARVRMQDGNGGRTYAYLRSYEGAWYTLGLGQDLTKAELSAFPEPLVAPGSLPEAGPAMVPTAEPVLESVPDDRRGEAEAGLKEVRKTVEDYEGTVGVYVQDKDGDWGYGIRPDERFYTASVIKLPVMAAVYRKIEAGKLSLSDTVATEDRDYAGGAGGLQWQEESVSNTIEDYLWMMIKQSDNVATNLLVRAVGGPEYVNEVAADLGAKDTVLQSKVTDQRAAAPGLDNYTTPRDMAGILSAIATGEVANESHTDQMLGLMRQNGDESWVGGGLPPEADPACKVGWINGVYNDVCLVQGGDGPYIISVFSKYGPPQVAAGASTLAGISDKVWKIQDADNKPEEKTKDNKDEDKKQNKED
jgi:beta-lactamase class A